VDREDKLDMLWEHRIRQEERNVIVTKRLDEIAKDLEELYQEILSIKEGNIDA
jgi:hypothetical protein